MISTGPLTLSPSVLYQARSLPAAGGLQHGVLAASRRLQVPGQDQGWAQLAPLFLAGLILCGPGGGVSRLVETHGAS